MRCCLARCCPAPLQPPPRCAADLALGALLCTAALHLALHAGPAHAGCVGCSLKSPRLASLPVLPPPDALQPVQASQRVAFLHDCKRPLSNLGPFWTGEQPAVWKREQQHCMAALQCSEGWISAHQGV